MISAATWRLEFPEQWRDKSPWHDRRVRLAANLALDKKAISEAERLGLSRLTGSIIPSTLDLALPLEPYPYDPAQAKRLLAEAGYPQGFDAGDITPTPFHPGVSWGFRASETIVRHFAPFFKRGRRIDSSIAQLMLSNKCPSQNVVATSR